MLAFFLFLLLAASAAATAKQCHDDDKAALLAINSALGNYFVSWTPDTPCCHWYNVDCDSSTGRIVALSVFQDASLTGAIPDAIANLTHLQTLVLHHLPALSGTIPDSLASLSNLSLLIISYTGVSGPVPSFLGELHELTMLDLSFNSLTGTIPASLADHPSLSGMAASTSAASPQPPCRHGAVVAPQQIAPRPAGDLPLAVAQQPVGKHPGRVRRGELRARRPVAQRLHRRRVGALRPGEGAFLLGPVPQRLELQPVWRGVPGAALLHGREPQRDPWQHPGAGGEPDQPAVVQRQLQQDMRRGAERREHAEVRCLQLPAQQVPLRCPPCGLPSTSQAKLIIVNYYN